MPTDIETEREDRLASVSESGVSIVTKERMAEMKAQLDEDRHLLEQERAIQVRTRTAYDKERRELDEKAENVSIESERLRERTRELEQRETALRQRENNFAKRSDEATNPRLDEKSRALSALSPSSSQEWELPTVAASVEQVRELIKKLPPEASAKKQPEAKPKPGSPLRQIMLANPIATFSFGFAAAMIAMIIMWSLL